MFIFAVRSIYVRLLLFNCSVFRATMTLVALKGRQAMVLPTLFASQFTGYFQRKEYFL
jgi:hypothetical protein